ncbi:MAG: hypothetical protein MUF44_00700 [Hydrogenophaga sp.]|jgi:hypothetical protein|nr:hypothetical protein [Hydrogenophaga sp.]
MNRLDVPADLNQREQRPLPWYELDQLPPLTAFASSIFATMLFPGADQELERQQCAQSIGLDWRTRYGPDDVMAHMPILKRDLFNLLEFSKRFTREHLAAKQVEGVSAGYLLRFTLLLDKDTTIEVASMKKSIALLVKFEPVGARTLQSRWHDFRHVSHLWAALSDLRCRFQKISPTWGQDAWINFMRDPRPVLATAEHYRSWGINFQPKGSSGHHVLDTCETWAVPKHVGPLPSQDFFTPELLYAGLTTEAREMLESYRR